MNQRFLDNRRTGSSTKSLRNGVPRNDSVLSSPNRTGACRQRQRPSAHSSWTGGGRLYSTVNLERWGLASWMAMGGFPAGRRPKKKNGTLFRRRPAALKNLTSGVGSFFEGLRAGFRRKNQRP